MGVEATDGTHGFGHRVTGSRLRVLLAVRGPCPGWAGTQRRWCIRTRSRVGCSVCSGGTPATGAAVVVADEEDVMDLRQVANETAAWVEVWLHGNAQPRVVLAALSRLGDRAAGDPAALAIVERGQRVVATHPFGSVQEASAA